MIFSCALLVEDCSAGPLKNGAKFLIKMPFQVVAAPFQLADHIVTPVYYGFKRCGVNCYAFKNMAITRCKADVPNWDGILYEPGNSECKCCKDVDYDSAIKYKYSD